jgi:hypothetical protein
MNPHIQIVQENEHTHEEDDDLIGKNEALNQMKDAIREALSNFNAISYVGRL